MKLRVYRKTVSLRHPLKILLTLIVKETGYVNQGCCNSSSSSSRTKKKNWTGFCKTLGPLVRFYTCACAFSSEARSLHRPAEPDGSGPPSRQTHTPARVEHGTHTRLMTHKSKLFTENLSAVPPPAPPPPTERRCVTRHC